MVEGQLAGLPNLNDAQKAVIRGQLTLVAKAWKDEAYKQALVDSPRETVQKEFGVEVPEDIKLSFLAEDASNVYLQLPPDVENVELSDEQLESVAGGEAVITVAVIGAVGLGIAAGITAGGAMGAAGIGGIFALAAAGVSKGW